MTSPAAPSPAYAHPDARNLKVGGNWIELLCVLLVAVMSIQVFGGVGVLLQLALFMLIIVSRPWAMFDLVTRWWFLFLVPLLACASTFWSWAPDVSLRYGVQFLITALMGAIIGRVIGPRAFVRVLFLAMLLVCVGSILHGGKGTSASGLVLVGLTGSKNQISYLAQILVLSGMAMILDRGQPKPLRLIALGFMPIALWLLIQAHAATGVVTTAAGAMVLAGVMILRATRPLLRAAAIGGVLLATAPVALSMNTLVEAAQDFTFNVLKKDSTLTGRTVLWARADDLIRDRPVLGHGYRAAWLSTRVESIGLLRWTGLPDVRGFHFHDTYRELAVDMGVVGAGVFALTLLAVGLALGWKSVVVPTASIAFLFSMFVVLALRSKGDLIIGPFSIFYAIQGAIAIYGLSGVGRAFNAMFARPAPFSVARPARGPVSRTGSRVATAAELRGGPPDA